MKNDGTHRYKKLNIFLILFAGFLASLMVTMMYIGGSFNFQEFSSAGRVYDVPQEEMKKTVSRWRYSQEENGFRIRENNSLKKYQLNGREQKWRYLYITIDNMSTPVMSANIVYFAQNRKKVMEQPVTLGKGENIIILNKEIPVYQIGIRLLNQDGELISIQSLQVRWNASGIVPGRFEKILLVSYTGFLVVLGVFLFLKRKKRMKIPEISGDNFKRFVDMLLYSFHLLIDNTGKRMNIKLKVNQKRFFRRLLFSLLFLWMVFANVTGWTINKELYRYNILICSIILLLITVCSWEKTVRKTKWNSIICTAWIMLAVGMMISDLFVETRAKFAGAAMLFVCGALIAAWNSMENPKWLIFELMEALEIDFIVAVIYCMMFRTKKLTIQYNGIFRSSDEFSMYGVLMLSIFLTELFWLLEKEEINVKKYAMYLTGAAISMYFVIRAAVVAGFVAALMVIAAAGVKELGRSRACVHRKIKNMIRSSVSAGAVAILCVSAVHFSTKYLPEYLHMEIEYGRETLISNVSSEEMEAFEQLKPGLMNGAVSKEYQEIDTIQKNYIRRLGIIGRGERIKVFRKTVPAYSGYIQMAYRYGIFILLPYAALQICMVYKGMKENRRDRKHRDVCLWILMVTGTYICFCVRGNAESEFGHPLWLCFYLLAGFWFVDKDKVKEKIEQIEKGAI